MEIAKLLDEGGKILRRSGVENPGRDAQLLLGHCLAMSRTELFLHGRDSVDDREKNRFLALIERRARREPVAYILREKEFWSLTFHVGRDVLIPRPETEFLLEVVVGKVRETADKIERCVDLCCGSGAIAVVLALELDAKVVALDSSAEALAVAKQNCLRHHVENRVELVQADLLTGLPEGSDYPLIVSNPPYVRRQEIDDDLEPEVAEFEPRLALDGGEDGLSCIRRIAATVLNYLSPAGMFFMEFGADQAEHIVEIFSASSVGSRFFEQIEIHRDYSGRDRVLFAKANSN